MLEGCVNFWNAYFIDTDWWDLFEIENNTPTSFQLKKEDFLIRDKSEALNNM
jgi:hypothetical protein